MNDQPQKSFPLQVQFESKEQQIETASFGMWVFLCTEVLFFGALFCAYIVFFYLYPNSFIQASHHQHLWAGTLNTFILLISSWLVVQSEYLIKRNHFKLTSLFLILTCVCGFLFLLIKAYEYYDHYQHKLIPGIFSFETFHPELERETQTYFYLYFVMTFMHAIHMLIGIVIMGIMSWRAYRKSIHRDYHTPLQVSGLYWHFVDIVWVFLYPLLYLIGVSS